MTLKQPHPLGHETITECVHAMAPVVNHQSLTTEAQVPTKVSPCGIYGGQIGIETTHSLGTSLLPCHYCTFVHLSVTQYNLSS
jgi:hypothetical protein